MHIDLSTASTHNLRHLSIGANHRYRVEVLTLEWQDMLFVFEQDDTLCCRFPNQRTMLRQVGVLLWACLRVLEEVCFDQQLPHAPDTGINDGFGDFTPSDGFDELQATPARRGHL